MNNSIKYRQLFEYKKPHLLLLAAIALIIITEAGFLIVLKTMSANTATEQPATQEQIQTLANNVVKECAKTSYKPTCYDEIIPKATTAISMEQSFEVTRLVQNQDSSYAYCHVLGHKLSARETAKDPSKWKDVVARSPSGLCSNGAIHGAFQERFRTEFLDDAQITQLKPDLKDVCEPRGTFTPTGLEQASCYHAIGHLMMYITNANIDKSIALCKEVAKQPFGRDYTRLCYDGTFMQIFQPLEPEDFALVKGKQPTKDQLVQFCAPYEGEVKGSCLAEGWPLFRTEIGTPEGLTAFCNNITDPAENSRCYNSMFYVMTPQLQFDTAKITDYCGKLQKTVKGQCFANAASRMIETDYNLIARAGELCLAANNIGLGDTCYQELTLYSTYNFHAGSEYAIKVCNLMPEVWKTKCLLSNGIGQGRVQEGT